jgi:hypothetical protein
MMHSAHGWRGCMVRVFFMIPPTFFLALNIYYLFHIGGAHKTYTLSQFFATLFYLLFLFISFTILLWYTCRGQSTTTIDPCITVRWYKIYTLPFSLSAVALLIITALESKLTYCGKYTTIPADWTLVGENDSCMYVCDAICSGQTKKTKNATPGSCKLDYLWQ